MDEQKEKQNAKKKRSTLPIYAIGAVWLLYAKKLDSFRGILSCAVVSLIVYAILRIVMRGKKSEEPPKTAAPEQPQPKQEEKKPEPQPQSESDEKLPPELQSVIYQGKRAIADIRRLNDEIPDERMSAQIDLIERLTAQIFDCVRQHPEKLSQIRQFLNYYLPTTIKLMEQYVTLQNQRPPCSGRLLLPGQFLRQRIERDALLAFQDPLHAQADLLRVEICLLSARRRTAQEPAFRDQAHPLPAVQCAIRNSIALQQFLFGNQILIHVQPPSVTLFRNTVTSIQ